MLLNFMRSCFCSFHVSFRSRSRKGRGRGQGVFSRRNINDRRVWRLQRFLHTEIELPNVCFWSLFPLAWYILCFGQKEARREGRATESRCLFTCLLRGRQQLCSTHTKGSFLGAAGRRCLPLARSGVLKLSILRYSPRCINRGIFYGLTLHLAKNQRYLPLT